MYNIVTPGSNYNVASSCKLSLRAVHAGSFQVSYQEVFSIIPQACGIKLVKRHTAKQQIHIFV